PTRERASNSFDDVTFYYPGAEQPALENISFQAKEGETTAIIGGTGAGKSTLINLIPRFYDATSGTIKINGVEMNETTQKAVREKLGLVPHKALYFSATITEK